MPERVVLRTPGVAGAALSPHVIVHTVARRLARERVA